MSTFWPWHFGSSEHCDTVVVVAASVFYGFLLRLRLHVQPHGEGRRGGGVGLILGLAFVVASYDRNVCAYCVCVDVFFERSPS